MHDYQIIIEILSQVLAGRNLNEAFTNGIAKADAQINIGKVKDVSYGVLRYYYSIDAILNKLVAKKPKDQAIYIILLIAIYEIKYTKKPKFAIANDLVELSYTLTKNAQIKNFVNAIVRNYLRTSIEIENDLAAAPEFKYNFPLWWIKKIKEDYRPKSPLSSILNNIDTDTNTRANEIDRYTEISKHGSRIKSGMTGSVSMITGSVSMITGSLPMVTEVLPPGSIYSKYEEVLLNLNQIPKINLRVNVRKTSVNDYVKELQKSAIEYVLIDSKISLTQSISVDKIPLFAEGFVSIQDLNAQKLIDLIKPAAGEYVLDACSAPGGKLCQILENFDVETVGLEIDDSRLDKVRQNLTRLGLIAQLINADASGLDWWDKRQFDLVVADVPCSASGTVKRNPDIKLHRQPSDIANFVTTQRKIITNLWQVLKPGGLMVYITCSIFKEENQDNIKYFSKNLPGIKVIQELKLLPTEFADGFYYCILQKVQTL